MKNSAVCYLSNNKNTEEMERRYRLLSQHTDNFILTEERLSLAYSQDVNTCKFNSIIQHMTSPFARWTYVSLIDFYNKFPDYDYYWLLEDDLIFNGDFSVFFNDAKQRDEDIILCHGCYNDGGEWFSCEESRIHNYEVDIPTVGGLAVMQRWSNKLACLLSNLHAHKTYGHLESFPCTVAHRNNLKIGFLEEIFKEQAYYMKNYCNYDTRFNLTDLDHLPKNTLIHAVKF
jgi:hypothetical protein